MSTTDYDRTMAALEALSDVPYVPENDDMAELLAARLGALR